MKKPHLIAALCAVTISALAFTTAHAALVNPILGLNIVGYGTYDVTFHEVTKFNALWDLNDNEVFGDDGSVFNAAPTFWGNPAGALAATTAITAALGTVDVTYISGSASTDSYFVPYAQVDGSSYDYISGYVDKWSSSVKDELFNCELCGADTGAIGEYPYASFVPTAVPVPATVWLFASGLIGLIGVARRTRHT